MLTHSLMQALVSGSPLLSMVGGVPGDSSLDGKPCGVSETLVGLKQSVSSVSSTTYVTLTQTVGTLLSTAITREWLRAGKMAGVGTPPSTPSLGGFIPSSALMILNTPSTQFTFPVTPTLLTAHPGASIHLSPDSSQPSPFLLSLTISSSAHSLPPPQPSGNSFKRDATPLMLPNVSSMLTGMLRAAHDLSLAPSMSSHPTILAGEARPPPHFSRQLPSQSTLGKAQPYQTGLGLVASSLCPTVSLGNTSDSGVHCAHAQVS